NEKSVFAARRRRLGGRPGRSRLVRPRPGNTVRVANGVRPESAPRRSRLPNRSPFAAPVSSGDCCPMSSQRFRPLGVEPIEDRLLPSGFGFRACRHQSWGGRDSWSFGGGTFDSRTFDGGSQRPPPNDGFSRDAPQGGPPGDFGGAPVSSAPPPTGGPAFSS